ncbi:MAG: carboxypeptidase regulatory-like domain-containing protein, partial [Chitinophagales bacterium]
ETGAIAGVVMPFDGATYVAAIAGDDTVGSPVAFDGAFYIGGLSQGTYDVVFEPAPGFADYTIYDVNVNVGVITDLGVVNIPY